MNNPAASYCLGISRIELCNKLKINGSSRPIHSVLLYVSPILNISYLFSLITIVFIEEIRQFLRPLEDITSSILAQTVEVPPEPTYG